MASKRRNYTREFKVEAVRLITENGSGIREAAESLGVSQNSLRTWMKQLENEAVGGRSRSASASFPRWRLPPALCVPKESLRQMP